MAAVLKKRALAEFQRQEAAAAAAAADPGPSMTSGSVTTTIEPSEAPPEKVLRLRPIASAVQGFFARSPAQDTHVPLGLKLSSGNTKPLELLKSCTGKTPMSDVVRAVQVLSEEIPSVQVGEVPAILDHLLDAFDSQQEPFVRVGLLSLLPKLCVAEHSVQLSTETTIPQLICEKIIEIYEKEPSQKVRARAMLNLREICEKWQDSLPRSIRRNIFHIAKRTMTSSGHLVRSECLELLAILAVEADEAGSVKIVTEHIVDQDPRVRMVAYRSFLRLQERGAAVQPAMYEVLKAGLNDDYEGVREMALKSIVAIGAQFPDYAVSLPNSSGETIRLVDEVFGRVCSGMSDISVKVRTLCAELLGTMTKVSESFVDQTLDKKLMSNMRKKYSAHERQREYFSSGGRPTGRKYGVEDVPHELLDGSSMSLMDQGACGAFVHGLEDQCMAVRARAIESIAVLASQYRGAFARQAIDFLVDMFNDEIEAVRLQAVHSLTRIGNLVVIREDQLDTILSALEDFALDIREALHEMLSQCHLASKGCLKMCVDSLLDNLRRYPQDRRSLMKCFKSLGSNHASLVMILLPEVLLSHPFLDTSESNLNDSAYVCCLIMIFNAGKKVPAIFSILENHVINHYRFLRGSLPHLIPECRLELETSLKTLPLRSTLATVSVEASTSATEAFVDRLVAPGRLLSQRRGDIEILEAAVRDLKKVGEMDSGGARPRCALAATYAECCLHILRGLRAGSAGEAYVSNHADNAVKLSWKLVAAFAGLSPSDQYTMKSMLLKALGLQLMLALDSPDFVKPEKKEYARALLQHSAAEFLSWMKQLDKFKRAHASDVEPDPFVDELEKALANVDVKRPSAVAKQVKKILPEHVSASFKLSSTTAVRMASATIYEPTSSADTADAAIKFTANLILGIHLDCEVRDVDDMSLVRIKVQYPDQTSHLIAPRKSDVRMDTLAPASTSTSALRSSLSSMTLNTAAVPSGSRVHRILTTVPISSNPWSEACHVKLSICLDLSKSAENCCGEVGSVNAKTDYMSPAQVALQNEQQRQKEALIVDISEEVLVYVLPRAIRRQL